jgi:hypothetical protein
MARRPNYTDKWTSIVYRTVILSVVLYGCENWLLTLGEEPGKIMFENRMLRKTFGPKMDAVTGEWKRLNKDELHDLYDLHSLPNINWAIKSRRMRWVLHAAWMVGGRGAQRILMGRPEGKRPLGRPWRKWDKNVKMNLEEVVQG